MKITERFKHCLKIVLEAEGGLSNVKEDRGGLTNFGVTHTNYDRYRLTKGLKLRSVTEIEFAEVEEIYFDYWASASCDKLPEPLDLLVFDMSINSGAGQAVKTLQECLGVMVDGIFGRNTLNAVANHLLQHSITDLCQAYLDKREDFYDALVVRRPDQGVFLKGWKNRLVKLSKEANLG